MKGHQTGKVTLREITLDNFLECINLQVEEAQAGFVAANVKSLAEAKVDPSLVPLAIYDRAALGYDAPAAPMVGFTMYGIKQGVGFIIRIMIDRAYQRNGYGRAAIIEVIRRLRLYPEVEVIATSHRRGNTAAAALFTSLGFVTWDLECPENNPLDVYLRLQEDASL
ncbi:MAG TPA: GNAT family N-acetyltransferase [Blastocatellia bacterium]|jgi:diamine N-acetyltransferase